MFACVLFGLCVLGGLLFVPLAVRLFSSYKRLYQYTLLTGYVGGVLWLTLAKRWGMEVSQVRFQPFYVVRRLLDCWLGTNKISARACRALLKNSQNLLDGTHATPIEDLLLNIILFIPLGFLLPYIWPKLNFWKTALIALVFSAAIEGMQYFAQLGCCDIDDVINNTIGACMGYGIFRLYSKLFCH